MADSLCKVRTRTWNLSCSTTKVDLDMSAEDGGNPRYIIVKNKGTTSAFFNTGATQVEAAAVFPVASTTPTPQIGKEILPGQVETYEKDPEQDWVSVILESGTGNVSVTLGGNK